MATMSDRKRYDGGSRSYVTQHKQHILVKLLNNHYQFLRCYIADKKAIWFDKFITHRLSFKQ